MAAIALSGGICQTRPKRCLGRGKLQECDIFRSLNKKWDLPRRKWRHRRQEKRSHLRSHTTSLRATATFQRSGTPASMALSPTLKHQPSPVPIRRRFRACLPRPSTCQCNVTSSTACLWLAASRLHHSLKFTTLPICHKSPYRWWHHITLAWPIRWCHHSMVQHPWWGPHHHLSSRIVAIVSAHIQAILQDKASERELSLVTEGCLHALGRRLNLIISPDEAKI